MKFVVAFLVWFVKSDYVIVEMIPQLFTWANLIHWLAKEKKMFERFYRNGYCGVTTASYDNGDVYKYISLTASEEKKIEMLISGGNVNDIVAAAAADDTYCGFHKLLYTEKEEITNTDINQMFARNRPFFICLSNEVGKNVQTQHNFAQFLPVSPIQ